MAVQKTRSAVRLIVVRGDSHVLLLRYERDSGDGDSFWVPPGGAIESGESHRDAARRELLEETGIDAEICREIWNLELEFKLHGEHVWQTEKYFLVELDTAEHQFQNSSSEPILEYRWWSIDDMSNTDELVYPEGLAGRLRTEITN